MVLDCVSQPKNLAIAFNFAAQSFRSVEGLARLSQYFETAAVLNPVLGHDPVPER
jgi:hypothetical protein